MLFFYCNSPDSGIYNAGTGKARTFLDLIYATFHAMRSGPDIEFIDTPVDIRDTYQYFTEALMDKIRHAGFKNKFISLETGVNDYVVNYLITHKYQ